VSISNISYNFLIFLWAVLFSLTPWLFTTIKLSISFKTCLILVMASSCNSLHWQWDKLRFHVVFCFLLREARSLAALPYCNSLTRPYTETIWDKRYSEWICKQRSSTLLYHHTRRNRSAHSFYALSCIIIATKYTRSFVYFRLLAALNPSDYIVEFAAKIHLCILVVIHL